MLRKRMPDRLSKGVGALAKPLSILALLALVVVTASPALAEVYHVKLRNGATIDTAYQPQQASWDANLVVLLSDAGNWVGLRQQDIESVITESQARGTFGVSLNFNTVAIGWAPNDAPEPSAQSAQSATLQALQQIYQQQQAQSHYSVPQFVNTDQTVGIPARFVGATGSVPPQVPLALPPISVPAATAPAAPPAPATNQ
jgi:hypothetical protein